MLPDFDPQFPLCLRLKEGSMHLFALPKRQIFPYVLPSEPQTGALIFLQPIPGDTQPEKHEATLSLYGFSHCNHDKSHCVRHMSKS